MIPPTVGRRGFLRGGAAMALATGAVHTSSPASAGETSTDFTYEIVKSEADWRKHLSIMEYKVLRENDTELPHTSPLVKEAREGTYSCKACELEIYDSVWKVPLDIGWVFFSHAQHDSVLTGIDGDPPYGDRMGDDDKFPALIEVHCRRCSSHLGHLVYAKGKLVHCINGIALEFRASA